MGIQKKPGKRQRQRANFAARIWITMLYGVIDEGETSVDDLKTETDRRFLRHLIEDRELSPDKAIDLRYEARGKIVSTNRREVVEYLIDYAKRAA